MARVGDGGCGVEMAAGVAGPLKGKAGDLGQLVSKRGSEDRGGELGRALRAGEGKEEGDGTDRWARGGRWERTRAREPGWSERRSELGRGAGPGELLGRGGERAAVRWAAGCVSLGHGGVLGRTREGEDGPRVGKRSRPGWVVFGIGLGCHLGSWAGWVLGFSNPFLFLFPFLFPTKQT